MRTRFERFVSPLCSCKHGAPFLQVANDGPFCVESSSVKVGDFLSFFFIRSGGLVGPTAQHQSREEEIQYRHPCFHLPFSRSRPHYPCVRFCSRKLFARPSLSLGTAWLEFSRVLSFVLRATCVPRVPRVSGRMPDASTGEAAHQMNKKVNKSNSGRNPAQHYVRRFNMDFAMSALVDRTPWKVTIPPSTEP